VSNEQQLWGRRPGEPLTWFRRFERYRLMEPVRSVAAVFREEKGKNGRDEAPGRWYEEAKKWQWEERAAAWDAFQTTQIEAINAQERDKILRSGFALMHKRVKELDKLTRKLIKMASDDEKIWLVETRTMIMGEDRSQTTEKLTFNAPLFQLIDKYLDSIAKEMGERAKTSEPATKDIPTKTIGVDEGENGCEP
jgi:hypothetical protein